MRKVLDAFLALPVVAREDADLADLLPGPALLGALHRAAVAAARSVALPDGVVLLRGATPVEDQRLAAKESGHPPVSPGDWLVVYRSDLAAVSVAEVGERGAPTFVAIELVLGPAAPEGLRLDAAGVVVAWSGAKPCTPIGALQRGKARWEAWFRDLLPDRIEVQGLAEVFALDLRRLDGV